MSPPLTPAELDAIEARAKGERRPGDSNAAPLEEIEMTVRLANALSQLGVKSIGDLAGIDLKAFRRLRNCGKKTIAEARSILSAHGARFHSDTPDPKSSHDDVMAFVAEVRRQTEEIDHLRYLHSRALSAAKAAAGHLAGHRHSKTGSKEEFAACSVDEVVEILSHR